VGLQSQAHLHSWDPGCLIEPDPIQQDRKVASLSEAISLSPGIYRNEALIKHLGTYKEQRKGIFFPWVERV
jgi:hypothetical protein